MATRKNSVGGKTPAAPRASRAQANSNRPIETYEHRDKERVNNPPVALVTPETDPDAGQQKKTYAYDPHLDPQLQWAGKAEHTSFEVPTVSLHVHERIDPRTIIEAARKRPSPHPSPGGRGSEKNPLPSGEGGRRPGEGQIQLPLFEEERKEPLREAIEFYQHAHGWSNRLIAGDSLLVMNSLLEKEGMAGKVQMIYIDPPYGIKYGSNFQPFVNKRDVKDGKDEDLTAEPEQIKAFRDTWELGIHSYLTYLRDRLLLARELLTESGSIFVQISDENVHHVRELMDEVFGAGNFISGIVFIRGVAGLGSQLSNVNDFILWYGKDKAKCKYRPLFSNRSEETLASAYNYTEEPDGNIRRLDREELAGIKPLRGRRFKSSAIVAREATESGTFPFEFSGITYQLPPNTHWKTSYAGLVLLARANRITAFGKTLVYKMYADDFPLVPLSNVWGDVFESTFAVQRYYVVQTAAKVIQRCLLMTTDPGDLVFDPTCGSGTTAYVAEQWGRRWITCDTSRVALTLARQRLMTAVFDYYELAHPEEGVGSGFKYKTVPHVTLKSIANNPEIDGIHARWQGRLEPIRAQLNALVFPSPQPSPKGRGGEEMETKGRGGEEMETKGIGGEEMEIKGRGGKGLETGGCGSEENPLPAGEGGRRPGEGFEEWQIPREPDAGWPEKAKELLAEWWELRRQRQQEIDAAIARHAPQETLYDQPFVDKKRTRVSGPFTVEACPRRR
jgi:adenine-specific DNA-methyltransferase